MLEYCYLDPQEQTSVKFEKNSNIFIHENVFECDVCKMAANLSRPQCVNLYDRKWQDYVYIQCEYKSTKQKIKHLLREENKVKENKIS